MAQKKTETKKAAPAKISKVTSAKKTERLESDAARAAEVEANLGGSRPLRDFLDGAGWN